VIAPEGVEHFGKGGQLFVSLDEQGAAGMKDLVAVIEIDMRERLGQIEDSSDRHVEAHAPQQPAEDDEVLDESARRV
jgi:hypothetical protein